MYFLIRKGSIEIQSTEDYDLIRKAQRFDLFPFDAARGLSFDLLRLSEKECISSVCLILGALSTQKDRVTRVSLVSTKNNPILLDIFRGYLANAAKTKELVIDIPGFINSNDLNKLKDIQFLYFGRKSDTFIFKTLFTLKRLYLSCSWIYTFELDLFSTCLPNLEDLRIRKLANDGDLSLSFQMPKLKIVYILKLWMPLSYDEFLIDLIDRCPYVCFDNSNDKVGSSGIRSK
jgi:hypothetical protein